MKKDENYIFDLYGKVLKDDKIAKKEFVEIYLEKFPENEFFTIELSKKNLHMMYIHLISPNGKVRKRK